jgi:hypothetical protein
MGTPKYIETPEKLWQLFEEYLTTLEVLEMEVPHVKLGTVMLRTTEPMTMEGFKSFGHDKGVTIKHYVDNTDNAYTDYCTIVTRIKDRIYKNNFSRAAVGIYKENLIAKQLGLAEKIVQTNIEQPFFNDVPKNDSDKQDTKS